MSLVNDILDFSQIEAGKFSLVPGKFDIRQAIQESIDLIAKQAREKNLVVCSEVPSYIPQIVVSDLNRFKQVLINLLGNTVKFTFQGHVKVRVSMPSLALEAKNRDTFVSK